MHFKKFNQYKSDILKESSSNMIKPIKASIEAVIKMKTKKEQQELLDKYGLSDSEFKIGTKIFVHNKMQKGYEYELTEPIGKNFHQDFKPQYTPKQMLDLGVFGGKYCNDTILEYPKSWFIDAKLSPEKDDLEMNRFTEHSRSSLAEWKAKKWIWDKHDPRGWFEWYMRYYLGRRITDPYTDTEGENADISYDLWQIKRWSSFARHFGQIKANCDANDLECRRAQRQALLQWSWPSYGLKSKWPEI